ncbi:MAG: hypothetical protein D6785_09735 [Planctomycetota bacterium]|nr:MAG: hypothetical protein D6785_09735 [Planctomycetota bacterium]
MKKLFLIVSLFWFSSSGCTYLANRGNDALDIFHIKATFGPGILGSVRMTQGLTAGLGILPHVQKFGIKGRGIGHWEEYRGEAGAIVMGIPISFYYVKDVRKRFVSGNHYLQEDLENPKPELYRVYPLLGMAWWPLVSSTPREREDIAKLANSNPLQADRRVTEVGATAHLLVFGLDVSVDLLEIFDFILGWTTLDFQGDDYGSQIKIHKKKEAGEEETLEDLQAKR